MECGGCVLHGLSVEAVFRHCQDFREQFGYLADQDPERYVRESFDFLVQVNGSPLALETARSELAEERMREAWEALEGAPTLQWNGLTSQYWRLLEETYEQALAHDACLLHGDEAGPRTS